jgi:hypothetical protein
MESPRVASSPSPAFALNRFIAPGAPRRTLWLAIVSLALLLLLFARKSHALLTPQLWAEDGIIFYLQQDVHGWAKAWLTPYAGYFHFLPRLIATFASFFGPCPTPAIYNGASFFVWCGVVFSLLSPRVTLPGRVWLAFVVVVIPQTGEVLFQLCNVQWITALILVRQLVLRPASTRGEVARDALALVIAALTGPFSLILWPLFAWRAWSERKWSSTRIELGVVTAAAIAHIVAGFIDPNKPALNAPPAVGQMLAFVGRRVLGVLFFGWNRASSLSHGTQLALGIALVVTTVGILWLLRRTEYFQSALILAATGAILLGTTVLRGGAGLLAEDNINVGDRYLVLPRIVLLWLTIVLAVQVRATKWLVAAVVAWAIWINRDTYRVPPPTDHHWAENCHKLIGVEPAQVAILPDGWNIDYPGKRRVP